MKTYMALAGVLLASGVCAASAEESKQAPQAPASAPAAVAPAAQLPAQASPIAGVTDHIVVVPSEVPWGDPPPGVPLGARFAVLEGDPKTPNASFTFRVKMPNEYKIPPHFHPADEHMTVIKGTLNIGKGDKFERRATTRLPSGSFSVMPKGMHHYAWAMGETIVQVHGVGPWGITYVNPKDDPQNAGK